MNITFADGAEEQIHRTLQLFEGLNVRINVVDYRLIHAGKYSLIHAGKYSLTVRQLDDEAHPTGEGTQIPLDDIEEVHVY